MIRKSFFILICLLVFVGAVAAQDVTVPDLTGLSVPQAAAQLNRLGLKLGAENNQGWMAESGLPQNSISGQSIPAGQTAAPGTAIDVNVLRSPNVLLIYDDNDLTLVNNTGGTLNLAGLVFRALDGNGATFAAARWGGGLAAGDCGQVWSVGRGSGKDMPECGNVQWMTTNDAAEHFWTGAGGTTQFGVFQDGLQRATCAVANPGRCEFYVAGGAASDATQYVYFAYTPEHLAIINQSDNQWMALDGFSVSNNYVPPLGAAVNVADPTLYGSNISPVADIRRLAPGQCLLFTNSSPGSEQPPQPCEVIAWLDVGPSVIFWAADFGVNSSDGVARSCPAAVAGRLTICVMPR
ncbi:MAG: PASTA domain-containing protein [Chloroflexi bacterium]|nr:PASTA domain-containing protein [Chloroflexota bacterium]